MRIASDKSRGKLKRLFMGFFLVLALLMTSGRGFAGAPFSFLVLGDTRTEPFLTGGPHEKDAMIKVLKDRFHKVPELVFDENRQQLVRAVIGEGANQKTLNYRDGWVESIVETKEGESRVIMRDAGRKWVFNRVVAAIGRGASGIRGGAQFLLHGGDIPLYGFQGKSLGESPYWQLFEDELLSRLPPVGKHFGLPGRVFTAVGNHATWGDPELEGFMDTLPWLSDLGLTEDRRIYSFSFEESHFVFLDCGDYSPAGTAWMSKLPPFEVQMEYLTAQLNLAWTLGMQNVFVVYHKPSFVKVGHDPLPEKQSPHGFLAPFADKLNIFVFNSHTHTTEQYRVDKIDYLVLGGGGAPQKFDPAEHPTTQEELYWKGEKRVEEYNYLEVRVDGPRVKGLLHRFRPTRPQNPMTVVEMFSK